MFRRRKPPEPTILHFPPPRDPLAELVRTWRNRAADIATGNLRVRDKELRIIRGIEARTYLHAASELEHALEET